MTLFASILTTPVEKRKKYHQNLKKMLKDDALFIITSCNWTEEELKSHFEPGKYIIYPLYLSLVTIFHHSIK